MAWQAPNNQVPEDKDPWTGQSKNNVGKKPSQGPPLLEDLVKDWIEKIKGKRNNSGNKFNLKKITTKTGAIIVLVALLLSWFALGIIQLNANQEALVFRLGVYKRNLATGWHWYPWGIDQIKLFDRQQTLNQILATDVISQDANLAHIEIKLNYHVNYPESYALNYANPKQLIQMTAANALQQTAAVNKLDVILANDKNSSFNQQLQQNLVKVFAQQHLGVQLDQVTLINIAVPESIKETFDKIDALYDLQATQKQKAADYESERIVPAQTKADQEIADAKAYAQQAKLKALQEVADFLSIMPVYEKTPALVRYQLYSQTMKEILSKTNNVVVDEKANGVSIALPSNFNSTESAEAPAAPIVEPAAHADIDIGGTGSGSAYANVKGGY